MFKCSRAILMILFCIANVVSAEENLPKSPDYAQIYAGKDKYENFNRKVFDFNLKLNKFAVKPIHTIWASIIPEYGMERIQSAYNNIEYPKRVLSCLIQKNFKSSGTETVRFLTNTTVGIGGMFDPADRFLGIKQVDEDMEQALSQCKIKSGPCVVIPVLPPSNPRGLVGKVFDTALNPTVYVVTPLLAIIKAGLTVNKTFYIQPVIKMLESNYADPYDIAKKFYGVQSYIKFSNLDREDVLISEYQKIEDLSDKQNDYLYSGTTLRNEDIEPLSNTLTVSDIIRGGTNIDNIILKNYSSDNSKLFADEILFDYNPQCPVVDAMRTALFDIPEVNDSIWADLSVWNRSFANKIKTESVSITPQKPDYKFRYILQKDKDSPVAIIYPSIGEGVNSYHSVVFAKIFYDAGYSVIIQGSHFQWEFVLSMPDGYRPGIPQNDAVYLAELTSRILDELYKKHGFQPKNKIIFGTSFGAMAALYAANEEYRKGNSLNDTKYIAVCPPIDLIYAMEQVDKYTQDWQNNTADFKQNTALTAAKVLQLYNLKNSSELEVSSLPFSEDEGKLITGFVMHQKLSDLVFTLEHKSKCNDCSEFYNDMNNMNYSDYVKKYLLNEKYQSITSLGYDTSLYPIADYLLKNNNYKIYHAIDDYLTNTKQLKTLKQYTGKKSVYYSNGSHLGFLYRPEFIESLKQEIALN